MSAFDSSTNRAPLRFTIDEGQIIPGFEQAIIGMNPGKSKTTKVPADKAYGPHRKEMVLMVDRNQFPVDLKPKIGQQLQSRQADGRTIRVMVTDASELSVTLDANPDLCREKDLTFDIQLVEIV